MTESTHKATIVSPVSRFLPVGDLARSIAMYRDLLGFEIRSRSDTVAKAVRGPACIELRRQDSAYDSTWRLRPRGAAMLFFQTNDVAALRSELVARGGEPSELENVNWIKMRMFQLQDPDGHTLWFGQSFHGPEIERPDPLLWQIMPSLPLTDVAAGLEYYRDVLGFAVNYAQHDLAVMDRDKARILLVARGARFSGIGACYVYVRDADKLHTELTGKDARVQGAPVSRPWGLREFLVLDWEGNEITFGQPFE